MKFPFIASGMVVFSAFVVFAALAQQQNPANTQAQQQQPPVAPVAPQVAAPTAPVQAAPVAPVAAPQAAAQVAPAAQAVPQAAPQAVAAPVATQQVPAAAAPVATDPMVLPPASVTDPQSGLKNAIENDFKDALSFPLDEDKIIAYVQATRRVQRINDKWDVQIASTESAKTAIEYNNYSVEEIMASLQKIPNLTLEQYNEMTRLVSSNPDFNRLYLAYKDLIEQGKIPAAAAPFATNSPDASAPAPAATQVAPQANAPAAAAQVQTTQQPVAAVPAQQPAQPQASAPAPQQQPVQAQP